MKWSGGKGNGDGMEFSFFFPWKRQSSCAYTLDDGESACLVEGLFGLHPGKAACARPEIEGLYELPGPGTGPKASDFERLGQDGCLAAAGGFFFFIFKKN